MDNENAMAVRDRLRRIFPGQSPDPTPEPPSRCDVIPTRLGELLNDASVSPEDLIAELATVLAESPDAMKLTWWPKVEVVLMTLAPQYLLQLSENAVELKRQLAQFNCGNESSTDVPPSNPF